MGLSERKVKQRIGLDPRNLSWSDDKSRFSYKHMSNLGWQESKGLGSDQDGNPNHIAVVRKLDNGGIGMARARKEGDDSAVGAGQAGQGLEDVLKRLAGASASPSPAPAPVVADGEEAPKKLRNKIASRQKHLHSKRLASSSPAALAAILGVPISSLPASPSPAPSSSSSPQPEAQAEASSSTSANERTADETVTTSTLSVSDYFRQKMREKMAARQGGGSGSGASTPVAETDLPASSLERIKEDTKVAVGGAAWEGNKVSFAPIDEVVEFEPTLEIVDEAEAAGAIDEKAAKKARKEAKRLAKLAQASNETVPASEAIAVEVEAAPSTATSPAGKSEDAEKAEKRAEKEDKKAKKSAEARVTGSEANSEKKKRKRDGEAVVSEDREKKSKKDKKSKA